MRETSLAQAGIAGKTKSIERRANLLDYIRRGGNCRLQASLTQGRAFLQARKVRRKMKPAA
jgi:hypothetical protein